ncbi:MAG: tRNA (guanosine(37)-N1)-methyltransferase TrmD [Planctomycetota bacterium]|jgi:tRNA (guanine37-N1)-methyltransferase
MKIDVLTLFPEVFPAVFNASIIGRAVEAGLVSIDCTDIREFATDNHRTVDDRPFGGGPGMVMMCGPVFDAFAAVESEGQRQHPELGRPCRVMLTPQGERLNQAVAEELSREPWLVLLCGHYEGFDERIREGLVDREISVGDYVLSGGETAAMVLVDAMVRLLPGVLGDAESAVSDTFSEGLLEYPQYTRPREFRGMHVPEVLLSGDHGKIRAWRDEQRMNRTRDRRPDLLDPPNAKT